MNRIKRALRTWLLSDTEPIQMTTPMVWDNGPVKVNGNRVSGGLMVVGTTGRSAGPHIHAETIQFSGKHLEKLRLR